MKKLFSFLLAIVLVISAVPKGAFLFDVSAEEYFYYEDDSDCNHMFAPVLGPGAGLEPDEICYSNVYDIIDFCVRCGAQIPRGEEYGPHEWYEVDTKEPTCTEAGYIRLACQYCNDIISEEVPATGHTYSNECDRDCNECGDFRKAPHSYDNNCDDECDLCGTQRDVEDHIYDNACDIDCNECGVIRNAQEHVYDNDCDTVCNVCDNIRTIEHSYDNACDTTCNICGNVRETTHVYDNDCDYDCNECGIVRDRTHVYDNVCDAECNICGEKRVSNHSYSNNCDIDCNICGFIRTVEHIFTNECDGECDLCFDTRKAPHEYANACDSECDLCGKTRAVSGHIYDDENDTFCNICGKNISNGTTIPMFVVSSVSANAGQTVKITISTVNNPGVVSMQFLINYDNNALKLVSAKEDKFKGVTFGPMTKVPFIATWIDPLKPNNDTNGVVVTLEFEVLDTAPNGKSAISITYEPENVFKYDPSTENEFENVYFDTKSGYITIYKSGDANGDGKVNGRDYGVLLQYLNGWDITIDKDAADVNDDANVNGRDYGLLLQYLNGWDVVFK